MPRPHVDPAAQKWLVKVGKRVREQRIKAGLTQQSLAEKSDLAVRNVQKIEYGEFACLITTLSRLRNALGCSYDDLMSD